MIHCYGSAEEQNSLVDHTTEIYIDRNSRIGRIGAVSRASYNLVLSYTEMYILPKIGFIIFSHFHIFIAPIQLLIIHHLKYYLNNHNYFTK